MLEVELVIGNNEVKKLIDEEIIGQCIVFFVVGLEIVGVILVFIVFYLVYYLDVQDKLFCEIDDVVKL